MYQALVIAALSSALAGAAMAAEALPADPGIKQRAELGAMPSDPNAQVSWKLRRVEAEIAEASWLIAMGAQGEARAGEGVARPGAVDLINDWRGAAEMWRATKAGGELRLYSAENLRAALLRLQTLRSYPAPAEATDRAAAEVAVAEAALDQARAKSREMSRSAGERGRLLRGSSSAD